MIVNCGMNSLRGTLILKSYKINGYCVFLLHTLSNEGTDHLNVKPKIQLEDC